MSKKLGRGRVHILNIKAAVHNMNKVLLDRFFRSFFEHYKILIDNYYCSINELKHIDPDIVQFVNTTRSI